MYIIASPAELKTASEHLSKHDSFLEPIIAGSGLCDIVPHNNYYQKLVESIIGQQLSVKAAASIRKRFVDMFDGVFPSPEQILEKLPKNSAAQD